MAFSYNKLIRQAALRVGAITGSTAAAKQASLGTTPLTTSVAGSVEFPLTALQDAAIGACARLVRAYASVDGHPFRAFNMSQTGDITSGSLIPAVDSTSRPIVGVLGTVRAQSSGAPMTQKSLQVILSIIGDAQLKRTYNYYHIRDQRLYATATAVIDVVTFDETAERSAVANGNTPLPDALFDAAWCAMAALLATDDAYFNQAQAWNAYVENVIAEIRGGQTQFGAPPEV